MLKNDEEKREFQTPGTFTELLVFPTKISFGIVGPLGGGGKRYWGQIGAPIRSRHATTSSCCHQYCNGRWWQLSALFQVLPLSAIGHGECQYFDVFVHFPCNFALLPSCMFECKCSMFLVPSGIPISFPQ
jgi:hypothetical protein